MKRIFISLLLAVLVGSVTALELGYVGSRADSYTARIQAVDAQLQNGSPAAAAAQCRALERDWEHDAAAFHALLIHDYADSIGSSISKMRVHLEHNHPGLYFAESADAKKGLASIKGSEYPLFENIL